MKTSSKQKEQEVGSQRKIVIFEDPDQKWGEIEQNLEQENLPGEKNVKESWRVNEQNPEQENWSGDSGVKGNGRDVEQDLEDKILSEEFRWMSRTYKLEPAVKTCSVVDSPVDNNSELSEQQHRIRIVRIGDPRNASGDSIKRLGQGSRSRP